MHQKEPMRRTAQADLPMDPFLRTLEDGIRRSEFFGVAGKVVGGAAGIGGLSALLAACGSSSASTSSAKSGGSTNSAASIKKIALLESAFAPFYTDNLQEPLTKYLATTKAGATLATTTDVPPGWSDTFGSEDSTVPTGIQRLNEYVAGDYPVVILSTSDEMSAWEHAVQQATSQGTLFMNYSTQAVAGATQNNLFSHKASGVGIGQAAVAWAHKNNITAPVVALIGNLTDAQGSKRTTYAWKTIKAALPNASLAGQVQGVDTPTGTTDAANLLSAHPNINMLISFNTPAGVGALSSATHAGKTDPTKFFLACTDFEAQTLSEIASGTSVMQANWGSYFPAATILIARDAINHHAGQPITPTRLLLGVAISTREEAESFNKVVFDPLNPSNADVYTKYFESISTPVGTAQVPPGQ